MKYIAQKIAHGRKLCGCSECAAIAKYAPPRPRVRREDDAYAADVVEALGSMKRSTMQTTTKDGNS